MESLSTKVVPYFDILEDCIFLCYYIIRFDYYGTNDEEKWKIDMVVDGTYDLRDKLYAAQFSENKEADLKTFSETVLPIWLGYFENLKKRNEGDFFVGNKVSIADIAVYDVMYECNVNCNGLVWKNATLKAFFDAFEKIPKYAEYRKSPRFHKE